MIIDVKGFGSLNYDYLYMVDSLASGDYQATITKTFGSPGGSSANTIYSLAKLGIRTGFLGALGADVEGEQILSQMGEVGIETSKIKILSTEITSKVFVFVDKTGERAMYSLPGASSIFRAEAVEIRWLSEGKYTIFSPIPGFDYLEHQKNIINQINQTTKVIFMPGALYCKYSYSGFEDVISNLYLMILNRREVKDLTDRDYISGAKWLVDQGCSIVAVTTGADGCLICDGEECLTVATPKLPNEKMIDSTGAGDAFAAGLVYGILNKKSLTQSALYGNLTARFCIQSVGARFGLPDKNSLEAEFKKYSNLIEK